MRGGALAVRSELARARGTGAEMIAVMYHDADEVMQPEDASRCAR